MARRKTVFANDNYYHLYNRGVNKQPIFTTEWEYKRMMELLAYYRHLNLPMRYSLFAKKSVVEREEISKQLIGGYKVEIIAYCFMLNHFHLLIKQIENGGISRFMSDFQNGYVKYFNIKNNRVGPLFQGQFKAVRVEDDRQLLHLTRYIHLNPYSSQVVHNAEELLSYKWSSFDEYIQGVNGICDKEIVFSLIKKDKYKDFVLDRAGYQRDLNRIKHLTLE